MQLIIIAKQTDKKTYFLLTQPFISNTNKTFTLVNQRIPACYLNDSA